MNFNIGKKIKALRLASDLTQEELANRSGLTKGFISQVENENFQTSISLESLGDLIEVLGISLAEFFSETDVQQVVFKKDDRSPIDGTGAKSFEMLVPGSTNNIMDPILVELNPGEQLEKRQPHSGEQFGYVIKGTITIGLAKETYKVTKDNCFYFTSDKQNQIKNNSSSKATLLWVITPPQM